MTAEAIGDDVQVLIEVPADSLTMREFLETFGADLMDKAAALYPPVLEHQVPDLPQGLRRMPKGGQAGALAALKVGLELHRQTFLVAEPGSGKTFLAITAATMANCRRVLVICPPHLTEKWAREVGLTVDQPAYIIGSISDLERVRNRDGFFILSRERAKLGPHWKPAVMLRRIGRERQCCCPNCGEPVMDKGIPMSLEMLERKKFKCESCRSPLWSVDRAGPRRVALAEYISRKLPHGFFDLFVLDECFPGDTPVATPNGSTAIKDLRIGDLVWSSSGGEVVARRVVRTIKKRLEGQLVRVVHETGSFRCTPNHKIQTQRGYVAAGELRPSDTLMTLEGNNANHHQTVQNVRQGVSNVAASEAGTSDLLTNL